MQQYGYVFQRTGVQMQQGIWSREADAETEVRKEKDGIN